MLNVSLSFSPADPSKGFAPGEKARAFKVLHHVLAQNGIVVMGPAPLEERTAQGVIRGNVLTYVRTGTVRSDLPDTVSVLPSSITARFTLLVSHWSQQTTSEPV